MTHQFPTLALLKELFTFRSLTSALVKRHVASRYRGSVLGFVWSLMNPLCLMVVYTLVFHYFIRVPAEGHYHILLLAGLLPWLWTASALSEGTSSIVASGHLITKSMFPAHILPFVAVVSTMINFILSLPVLLVFLILDGMPLSVSIIALPIVLLIHGTALFGAVLFLSSLNVLYRDVQHIVANALTLLFFLTPIVYPISTVPERFRPYVELNPLAVLSEVYRDCIVRGAFPNAGSIGYLIVVSIFFLLCGTLVYDRYREQFAEVL